MYNTIEVIFLDIKSAEIKYFKKDGFVSAYNDNTQHIKVLPYLSIVQSVEGSYDIALGNAATMQTGEGGFFVAPSEIQQTIVHHTNKKSGTMIDLNVPLEKSFSFYFFDAASAAIIRKSVRLIFPLVVFGRDSTNSIRRGYLYGAVCSLT